VAVVLVDDRDRGFGAEATPELVGDQGAAGTGAEDEDSLRYALIMPDRVGLESNAGGGAKSSKVDTVSLLLRTVQAGIVE
jgi:hypothetical protein